MGISIFVYAGKLIIFSYTWAVVGLFPQLFWFVREWKEVASGRESNCQCRSCGFNPWVGKIPWRRKWQPSPVFLPGESHEQRSLAGYSPWGHKQIALSQWALTHAQKKINSFQMLNCWATVLVTMKTVWVHCKYAQQVHTTNFINQCIIFCT